LVFGVFWVSLYNHRNLAHFPARPSPQAKQKRLDQEDDLRFASLVLVRACVTVLTSGALYVSTF
jgi:hypothetical protein